MHEGHSSHRGYGTGVQRSEMFLEWTPTRAVAVQMPKEPAEILEGMNS